MKLSNLMNRFVGRRGVLLGKGPGYEKSKIQNADGNGVVRVGINEAARGCHFGVALDRRDFEAGMPDGARPLVWVRARRWAGPGEVAFDAEHYHSAPWLLPAEALAARESLYVCEGSGVTALHLLWFMGIRRVDLYGVDGGGGYAVSFHAAALPADRDEVYARQLNRIVSLGELLGMDLCFHLAAKAEVAI